MNDKFYKNFFRKDLNLRGYWWHRLLIVITVVVFAYAIYSVWDTPLPKYRAIESLQNRMTTELQLLPQLVNFGEKIGQYENNLHGAWYEKNEGWALGQPNIYCARNISQHIEEVSQKTGVTSYKGNGATEFLTLENFKNYIINQKADCVHVVLVSEDNEVGEISWAWFIDSDLKVWRESNIASGIYILKQSLLQMIPFLVCVVLYFKVFLYIIFGSRKNNN